MTSWRWVTLAGLFTALVACRRDTADEPKRNPPASPPRWVRIEAGPFIGIQTRCAADGNRRRYEEGVGHRDVSMLLPAFEVLESTVTFAQWQACGFMHICDPKAYNLGPRIYWADVTLPNAERYCAWLGGRVPTLAELQRIYRGTTGSLNPGPFVDPYVTVFARQHVTASGAFRPDYAEWVSDLDCGNRVVAYPTRGLDEITAWDFGHATFRCVR